MEIRMVEHALVKCHKKGQLLPLEDIDTAQIKSLLELSEGDVEATHKLMNGLGDKSLLWNNAYTCYYDALHKLVDAFLRFDKVTSLNHLCLFAYLCHNHPDLELDWNFFEKIRTKRNGIHYYGQKVNRSDIVSIEIQLKLYINTLRKSIEKKLKTVSLFFKNGAQP